MSYFIYLVECSDKTYYCGVAKDLEARIKEHNEGKVGAKYTKTRRPVKLVYSEEVESRSDALKREFDIKKFSRSEKKVLVR